MSLLSLAAIAGILLFGFYQVELWKAFKRPAPSHTNEKRLRMLQRVLIAWFGFLFLLCIVVLGVTVAFPQDGTSMGIERS